MRIAITGGTGFVGGHLARALADGGHEIVLVARGVDPRVDIAHDLPHSRSIAASVDDEGSLVAAFDGCVAVVHCAGINREIGAQTYEAVHIRGTQSVVSAAKRAGVQRIALLSYLRARPDCGSGYLESKWAAEEIVRGSGIDYLVVKAGMIFGRGDHMLDHTAKAIGTFHVFTKIGLRDRLIKPTAVDDVVAILRSFVLDAVLSCRTIGVVGPEPLTLGEAATRIARAMQRRTLIVPMPIWALYAIAFLAERIMKVPLISVAQVRLLREGPMPGLLAEPPPPGSVPAMGLTDASIRAGLPQRLRYGLEDLRWFKNKR